MNIEQLPELLERVDRVEDRLHKEISKSIESRGVTFTVSAYTTALSHVIGQLIALSKDDAAQSNPRGCAWNYWCVDG